jgi:hypothetical protein
MLDWLKGYVARWAGVVDSATRDLVHWAVHALAGVVYAVFGNVGRAWHDLFTAYHWVRSTAADLVGWIVTHLTYIVKHDLPLLAHSILSYWRDALNFATSLYHAALRAVESLAKVARRWVDDAIGWVITHVYDPLLADARQLRSDLLKWGYTAWQIVTHPDRLAAIVGDALISWTEQQFWRIAGPVGTFALRIVVANLRKFVALAETIITAVL